jgi:hypothetical protein
LVLQERSAGDNLRAHYRDAIGTTLLLNHFSILRAAGVARADALQILSALAGIQAAVTLSTGALLDRHEPLRLVPVAMLLLRAASVLPALGGGLAVSWLYALSLGGAYGSQQAIHAAGYVQYFGRGHLGSIRGSSFIFGISGAALVRPASVRCEHGFDWKLRNSSNRKLRVSPRVRRWSACG